MKKERNFAEINEWEKESFVLLKVFSFEKSTAVALILTVLLKSSWQRKWLEITFYFKIGNS